MKLILFLCLWGIFLGPAFAGPCGTVEKVTGDLWNAFEDSARAQGCVSPIDGPGKYAACQLNKFAVTANFPSSMLKSWNHNVSNSWQTIGPRRLGPDFESGTINGPAKRLFVASMPQFSHKANLTVKKRDGKGELEVTICKTTQQGKPIKIKQIRLSSTTTITLENVNNTILSVKLTGKSTFKKFVYSIKLNTIPARGVDMTPIKGFADLHIHPASDLAFGGKFIWGSHKGNLHNCDVPNWQGKKHLAGISLGGEHLIQHGKANGNEENDWPSWKDGFHQKVHISKLKEAFNKGLKLAVFSMHDFQPLCVLMNVVFGNASFKGKKMNCFDMDSVDRQTEAYYDLIKSHNWMEIALNPWHARQIINRNKMAVILAVEVSNLFPKKRGSYITQLDKIWGKGVRSVILAHETDSDFAGAAMQQDVFAYTQWIKNLKNPLKMVNYKLTAFNQGHVEDDKLKRNPLGLTEKGEELLDEMVARKMIIDLEHLSEQATNQVLKRLSNKHRYYPAMTSHTRLGKLLTEQVLDRQKEFLTSDSKAAKMKSIGGIIGLRTGPEPMKTYIENGKAVVGNTCHGSSRSFAQMYLHADRALNLAVALGSDMNAPVATTGPRYGNESCPKNDVKPSSTTTVQDGKKLRSKYVDRNFHEKGIAHVGLLPDLVFDMKVIGVDTNNIDRSAEHFLRMWQRAYEKDRSAMNNEVYKEYYNIY